MSCHRAEHRLMPQRPVISRNTPHARTISVRPSLTATRPSARRRTTADSSPMVGTVRPGPRATRRRPLSTAGSGPSPHAVSLLCGGRGGEAPRQPNVAHLVFCLPPRTVLVLGFPWSWLLLNLVIPETLKGARHESQCVRSARASFICLSGLQFFQQPLLVRLRQGGS